MGWKGRVRRGAGCREKVETVRRSERALSPSRPVGRVFSLAPPQPPLIPSSSSSSPASPFFQSPVQGLPVSSTRPGRGHPLPPTPSPAGERSMQLVARRSRISFQFFFFRASAANCFRGRAGGGGRGRGGWVHTPAGARPSPPALHRTRKPKRKHTQTPSLAASPQSKHAALSQPPRAQHKRGREAVSSPLL